MQQLLWAIPRLYFHLSATGEDIYAAFGLNTGKRSILRDLVDGPQTIVAMADARPVSRQYVQRLVSELARDGLASLSENVSDRRSRLVRLTDRGRAVLRRIEKREADVGAVLAAAFDPDSLVVARDIIVRLTEKLRPPVAVTRSHRDAHPDS